MPRQGSYYLYRPFVFGALLLVVQGCNDYSDDFSTAVNPSSVQYSRDEFAPIPSSHQQPIALTTLGKQLFHDPLLSADNTISCAHCHQLNTGGDDNLPASIGIGGQIGEANSPTVLNAALNFRQFWDGRAKDLETQALEPVENPIEMGSTWPEVIAKLQAIPEYRQQFNELFHDGITKDNVAGAIASFEKTLLTPDSPFDRFLKGERQALDDLAYQGYHRFKQLGCVNCHQGINIGGNMYQHLGIMRDYFASKRQLGNIDNGLYNHTGREADRHKFKVPSLRNVADTAPYFHDGSAATLEEAVIVMGRFQLGVDLTDSDLQQLVAFLQSLSAPVLALEEGQ